jgi:hypothetical protein
VQQGAASGGGEQIDYGLDRFVGIVSQETWSVENDPRCRKFSDIADAVRAIMARAACEAAPLTRVKAA